MTRAKKKNRPETDDVNNQAQELLSKVHNLCCTVGSVGAGKHDGVRVLEGNSTHRALSPRVNTLIEVLSSLGPLFFLLNVKLHLSKKKKKKCRAASRFYVTIFNPIPRLAVWKWHISGGRI